MVLENLGSVERHKRIAVTAANRQRCEFSGEVKVSSARRAIGGLCTFRVLEDCSKLIRKFGVPGSPFRVDDLGGEGLQVLLRVREPLASASRLSLDSFLITTTHVNSGLRQRLFRLLSVGN